MDDSGQEWKEVVAAVCNERTEKGSWEMKFENKVHRASQKADSVLTEVLFLLLLHKIIKGKYILKNFTKEC